MRSIPTNTLIPAKAPNLPIGPVDYSQTYQDQLNNVLRLYFNQLDGVNSAVLDASTPGGRFLRFPYGAVQRTTNFTYTATNTAKLVTADQADYLNGVTLNGADGLHAQYAGIYNFQFSVQFANTDTQIHTAYIWLRKNGVDIVGTASKFDIPNKHGGTDGYLIAACNFYVDLNAGDYVELWSAADVIYVAGVSSGIYMEAYAAQTSPFAMPAIPSVVMTLSFVSALPA